MTTRTKTRAKPATTTEEPGPRLVERVELLTYDNGVKRTRVIDCSMASGTEHVATLPAGCNEDIVDRLSIGIEQELTRDPDVEKALMMLTLVALKTPTKGSLHHTRAMVKFASTATDHQRYATLCSVIEQLEHVKAEILTAIIERQDNEKASANIVRH
jgi:hypothetical protein